MRGTVGVVVGVCMTAVASQACRLAELTFSAVRVPSLIQSRHVDDDDNATALVEVTACQYYPAPFVARHETIYYNFYYWSRVILIHVIPCSALVLLNTGLIRTMREADHRRRRMFGWTSKLVASRLTNVATEMQDESSMSSTLPHPAADNVTFNTPRQRRGLTMKSTGSDSCRRSTMMLVVVVGVFLLVEVPLSRTLKYCENFEVPPAVHWCAGVQTLKCRCLYYCCSLLSKTRSTWICLATRRATRQRCSLTVASQSHSHSTSSSTAP